MKNKMRFRLAQSVIVPVVVFILMIAIFWIAISDASKSADAKSLEATERAINRAAVSCYAIEGRYPPDLAYLKEHYGITVNDSRYIINYEAFASNIRPKIQVLVKE